MSEKTGRAGNDLKETLPESRALSHEQANLKGAQYAELLNSDSGSLQSWASSNVWHPVANALIVEPHNAVSSTVNDISKALGGKEIFDDWKKYDVPHAKTSGEWLAQNVSSGLAMVVPYGLAALASKGALSPLAGRLSADSLAGKIISSNSAALITGATIYDGLKKPGEDQTRIGNALGAAVGFTVFESGTYLARGSSGLKLAMSRALTGGLGAGTQLSVSDLVSTGQAPSLDRLYQAAAQGAILNPLLGKGLDTLSPQSRLATMRTELIPPKSNAVESAVFGAVRKESSEALTLLESKKSSAITGGAVEGGFKSYADYQNRGWRYTVVDNNIFQTSNGTKIVYPKGESNYGRLSLEQTTEVLNSMPDRALVKKLEISDLAHVDEAWFRQQRNEPNFTIAGQSFPDGSVQLFRPNRTGAYDKVVHEWGHLFEQKNPAASAAFEKAAAIEKFNSGSNSHIEGAAELWPVLTESLLAKDNVLASASALANPVRSMVWAKAFQEHLASLLPQERSTMHDHFLQRAKLIENLSSKRATEMLKSTSAAEARAISEFLR